MPPPDGNFHQTGERDLLATSFLRFVEGEFVDPEGNIFKRKMVRHPGAVCIVAVEDDGMVVMIRQYRSAVDQIVLEVPAGKLDVPGEPPEDGARRELVEEAGREAGRFELLGDFYNSPGFTDERTYCYLAQDLRVVDRATQGIEEHFMTVELVPLAEIWTLVERGEVVDAKTIIACGLAERRLAGRGATA